MMSQCSSNDMNNKKNQQQGFSMIYLVCLHLLQLILISLQPSQTKGIQKQSSPVKKNKQMDQLQAAQPGVMLTKSDPRQEHTGQGKLACSTMNLQWAELRLNLTMGRCHVLGQLDDLDLPGWRRGHVLPVGSWLEPLLVPLPGVGVEGVRLLPLIGLVSLIRLISLVGLIPLVGLVHDWALLVSLVDGWLDIWVHQIGLLLGTECFRLG